MSNAANSIQHTTVRSLLNNLQSERLRMPPSGQCDRVGQSQLIEQALLEGDSPVVRVLRYSPVAAVVTSGCEFAQALLDFVGGDFALVGLKNHAYFDGITFAGLGEEGQSTVLDAPVRVCELRLDG